MPFHDVWSRHGSLAAPPTGPWFRVEHRPDHYAGVTVLARGAGIVHAADAAPPPNPSVGARHSSPLGCWGPPPPARPDANERGVAYVPKTPRFVPPPLGPRPATFAPASESP
jgi:hypothetical protein